ncbi:MAG: hypothetical protein WC001_03040 [Desulfurivibrionaceae bacterium]
MTIYKRIRNSSIMRTWVIAAVCCTIIATLVYGMMPPEQGNHFAQGAAYFLFPGVAFYVFLNGSLNFGRGFGIIGDFLIIGLGSALAWTVAVVIVAQGFSWLRQRPGMWQ